MRELDTKEIQNIAGGIDPCFFYGAIAGASDSDLEYTIKNCLIFGAVVGGIIGCASFPPIGLFLGIPAGALLEGTTGFLGYTIGTFIAGTGVVHK